ncbi:MAG: hypothetical protein P1U40_13735 [Coxiellaceae bacterium]|nr:hypothetical protein [Coxiellaceae bacterium]
MPLTADQTIHANSNWHQRLTAFFCSDKLTTQQRWLMVFVFMLLLFTRNTDNFLHPMLWAEDGAIFLPQMHQFGLKAFFMPFSGFLHSIGRTASLFASFFPYALMPIAYGYFALAAAGLMAWSFLSDRFAFPFKPLLMLSLILVHSSGEPFGSSCNLNEMTIILFFFLLFATPPTKKRQYVFDYILLTLLSFNGPSVIIFSPLFAIKYLKLKTNFSLSQCIIAVAGACTQLLLIHFSGRVAGNAHHFDLYSFKMVFEVFHAILTPGLIPINFHSQYIIVEIISSTLLCSLLIYLVTSSKPQHRTFLTSLLYILFATIAITFYAAMNPRDNPIGDLNTLVWSISNGSRYFYLPSVIIAWILCFGLYGSRFRKTVSAVMLVLILLNVIKHFHFTTPSHHDYNWPAYAARIATSRDIQIPINPKPWTVNLHNENVS